MAEHGRVHPSGRKAGRLIAAVQEGLVAIGTQDGRISAQLPLPGAGALCRGPGMLYCAADDGMIWVISPQNLTPAALFYGGPGIVQLCADGRRGVLYALCAEADSLLMCCARSGRPLFLSPAGVNPQGMAYDKKSGLIAVAGGRQEAVLLFDGRTLRRVGLMPSPGRVCAAALSGRYVYALCMTQEQSSVLVTGGREGLMTYMDLPGMPGMLAAEGRRLLAASRDKLYTVSMDGTALLSSRGMPGHAGKRIVWKGNVPGEAMLDGITQTLYLHLGEDWVPRLEGVRDILLLGPAGK